LKVLKLLIGGLRDNESSVVPFNSPITLSDFKAYFLTIKQ
jgi:hypothetical protein